MSWNSTVITVVGNVVSDITYRHGEDGKSNAFFRIASSERRYNTSIGDWEDGEVVWLGVSCWRRLADSVKTTLSKGDPVIVQGKLRQRLVEKDELKRTVFNLDALHIGLDLSRVQSLGSAPAVGDRSSSEDLDEAVVPF